MSTKLKRFSISVPEEMEKRLDTIKQERYYKKNQTEMIRDLIDLGLKSLENE